MAAERAQNSLLVLQAHLAHLGDASLNWGQIAKILHLFPEAEKDTRRIKIQSVQQQYWEKWGNFRCNLSGYGPPNFEDVVKLIGVREQFADFVGLQSGDTVIDLMAGSGQMAPYFLRTSGYIGIDSNLKLQGDIETRFTSLPIKQRFIFHDLSEGLPVDNLGRGLAEFPGGRNRFTSMWGITYLDAEQFLRLVGECLEFPNSTDLSFCMITDGSFDPKVLRNKFIKEVVPKMIVRAKFRPLVRAMRAIPNMIRFGNTFKEVMPLWYPEEITELLTNNGFNVEADSTLLWGQSTAIKVT